MISLPLIHYVLIAAIRDRMLLAFFLLLAVGCSLSLFLGSAAVIEKDRFSIVFASGGLRIASVMALLLFVVFFVRRSFDGKDIEFLLSRPISRIQFVLSLAVGFSVQAILISLAVGATICGISPHLISNGHVLWITSLVIENIIMVNTAFFFAMYISSAASASMAACAFYLLSRMMGQLLGIVDSNLIDNFGPLSVVTQTVSVLVPRLDLMAQTSWLLYGFDSKIGFLTIILQGAIFCFLVLSATLLDFVRRQF